MNTVGKKGKLGEQIRCVVSVSMLTEGWDTNTVTHILGIRTFRSQLLCEQVVGRGLRRRSYAVNDTGYFEPEYANVYGIPFQFISSDRPTTDPLPPKPVQEVAAVEGREHLRITFPRLDGYRIELPDEEIYLDLENAPVFEIGPNTVPRWVETQGVVGTGERDQRDDTAYRPQQVAYTLAERILDAYFNTVDDKRPWLFPQLVAMCKDWISDRVRIAEGYDLGYLMTITEAKVEAAENIWGAITRRAGRRDRLRPMLNRFDPEGSTAEVYFHTRKPTVPTEKSEVSHVTLDGKDGNTWEQLLAAELEQNPNVEAYVKNDHLGFTIPYVHKGRSHSYIPDFLVRLRNSDGERFHRTLIVEVSGSQKSPGPTQAKALTARDSWCAAVNNHGGLGSWGYIEMKNPLEFKLRLAEAIELLYGDDTVIGDPDLLDFSQAISDFEQIYFNTSPADKFAAFVKWLEYQAPDYYAESDADVGYATPDAVILATVHQAKGMQWPAVFIPCLRKNRFPSKKQGGLGLFHVIPETAIDDADRYRGTIEDETRLFYVAVTRAQKYLTVTFSPGTNQLFRNRSAFFDHCADQTWVSTKPSTRPLPGRVAPKARHERPQLTLSFSELKYLFECPYSFKLRFLYGFNPPLREALGYGKGLHDALAEIHKKAIAGELLDESDAAELVARHLHTPFAYPELRSTLEKAAVGAIRRYFASHGDEIPRTVHSEKQIQVHVAPGITVDGRIDLIRRLDTDELAIVDFKSTDRAQDEEVTRDQLHVYAVGYEELTGADADLIEVLNLDEEGKSTREEVEDSLLTNVRNRIREAGDALRTNGLPRLISWCSHCDRCDFSGLCRDKPESVKA